MSRYYASMAAALAELSDPEDLAVAAYLFAGTRPTVIRIRHDDESPDGGFIRIIEDDGLYVSTKQFCTIDELVRILAPEPEDDRTYVEAVATIVDTLKNVLT